MPEPILWRPLALANIARKAVRRPAARVLLIIWLTLTGACIVAGIQQVKAEWNALPVDLGPIHFSVTIYPPLIICLWMVFWLGLDWAFPSAYLSTLVLALYSGMKPDFAALFALVDPLALAVYALAYRSARVPFDLRGLTSILWYLFVSFVAAVAGSVGSFIWSQSRGLTPVETYNLWQGWWVGALLQAILFNAPVLALLSRPVERLKARFFGQPHHPEPSLRWVMSAIVAGGLVLAGFLLASDELAGARLREALQADVPPGVRNAVLNAAYSWKLSVWTGIVLALAGSFGGIALAYAWNRSLLRQVRARTKELEESEQRFRITFDHAAVGIAHVAPDGRWLRVNQKLCEIVGYSREELQQRTFQDITHAEDLDADLEFVRRVLAGEIQNYSMQKRYIHKNGSVLWIHLTVALVRGRRKEPRYFISVVEDISQRVQLEEQLRQSQKMEAIGRLAGGVAHDFNNLLTVIAGYGQMLASQLPPQDPSRYKAEEICRSADRAAALTSQLLAFSRRQVVQPKVVNMNDLVNGMHEMLQRLIGEAISLKTATRDEKALVKVDPSQFEQVIVNLAVNARDAMPEGGDLRIEVATVEYGGNRMVSLAIRDTGAGMDAEVQSHLFEPFYTTKDRGKGTGLGLSIVYGIVKQSSGTIRVDSQPGRGASFEILLPRIFENEPSSAVSSTPATTTPVCETILLVEDEGALRALIREVLRASGYNVLEAASGEEAVALHGQLSGSLSLLVTDMIMPGMNGRVLAEQLRALHRGLKVLYISGYTENLLDGYESVSADTAFLQKPFTPAVLTRTVRLLLDPRARS